MTKYYKVWLNEKSIGNYCTQSYVICKKTPVSIFFYPVFREVITDKLIYPNNVLRRHLTYVINKHKDTNYQEYKVPMCCETDNKEVEKWLKKMDEASLKKYVDYINKLEEASIKHYDESKHKRVEEKVQEKSSGKNIKRILKKIR